MFYVSGIKEKAPESVLKKSYCKYILALLLFGSNGVVASNIHLESYEIVLLRTLIGSILLICIFFVTIHKVTFTVHRKDLLFICISGIAMGASWMFLYEAYARVGVSVATLLYYCGPVVVIALSPILFQERLTIVKILGFLCALAGIYCVNGVVVHGGQSSFGMICGLLSALMYSVMVMANKKVKFIKGMENSMIQLAVSFLTVAIFTGLKDGFGLHVAAGDWGWILVLGLLNTGVGCYFYFSSIGNLPIQTVAVCGYLEPLSAVLFSVVLLHETMLPIQIFGAVLIIGGAAACELKFG